MRYINEIATVLFLWEYLILNKAYLNPLRLSQIDIIHVSAVAAPQLQAFAHDHQLLFKIRTGFAGVNVQTQRHPVVHGNAAVFLR
jgi:hypothetical protein